MAGKQVKEKVSLKVEKRKVLGKKVKKLRKEGILPANIYGKNVKSLAVQVSLKEFLPVYKKVGETGIVEVMVEGEKAPRHALIHNVQKDPVSDQPLHADFHQVSLTEKITASIPVELVGESPAVAQKLGVLIQPLSEVEVEALPTELPEQFTVDISGLKEVDQAITVGDLKPPAGVKILTFEKEILVKINPPTKEEVSPPPAEEAAAAGTPVAEKIAEEKPAGEEKKAEGAAPSEEQKSEPQKQ
jgi:large subunit ribosomal protein L25